RAGTRRRARRGTGAQARDAGDVRLRLQRTGLPPRLRARFRARHSRRVPADRGIPAARRSSPRRSARVPGARRRVCRLRADRGARHRVDRGKLLSRRAARAARSAAGNACGIDRQRRLRGRAFPRRTVAGRGDPLDERTLEHRAERGPSRRVPRAVRGRALSRRAACALRAHRRLRGLPCRMGLSREARSDVHRHRAGQRLADARRRVRRNDGLARTRVDRSPWHRLVRVRARTPSTRMSRPVAPAARMARELLAGCRSYRPTEDSPIAAIPRPRRPDRAGAVPIRRSEAALRYVNCDEPGLTRRRCGRGFAYFDATGAPVRDPAEKRRVAALAVPPAWTDVWLCIDPRGHIQATGRDEKGRKQYIYHPEWREQQERSKYTRLADFARVLGRIRRRIEQDLAVAKSDEPAVLAAAAQLLDLTGIRVGNRSSFEENGTVGLTTLESRHATIDGARIGLRFKAKSGKLVEMRLSDRRLARIL